MPGCMNRPVPFEPLRSSTAPPPTALLQIIGTHLSVSSRPAMPWHQCFDVGRSLPMRAWA
jgi:hypothetical protein